MKTYTAADFQKWGRTKRREVEIDPHASWQQRVVALAKAKGVELKEEGE